MHCNAIANSRWARGWTGAERKFVKSVKLDLAMIRLKCNVSPFLLVIAALISWWGLFYHTPASEMSHKQILAAAVWILNFWIKSYCIYFVYSAACICLYLHKKNIAVLYLNTLHNENENGQIYHIRSILRPMLTEIVSTVCTVYILIKTDKTNTFWISLQILKYNRRGLAWVSHMPAGSGLAPTPAGINNTTL